MAVFKIPAFLYDKYRGTGYGLVATVNGEIIDLKYFDDIDPEFYIDSDAQYHIKKIIMDNRLAETMRYFQALGQVSVGIFSCYEFCEL